MSPLLWSVHPCPIPLPLTAITFIVSIVLLFLNVSFTGFHIGMYSLRLSLSTINMHFSSPVLSGLLAHSLKAVEYMLAVQVYYNSFFWSRHGNAGGSCSPLDQDELPSPLSGVCGVQLI